MKIILLAAALVTLGTAQTASELNKKAESLYSQGKKSEAHELFLQAHELDNSSAKIMGNLSVSYLGRGEYDRAIYWGDELLKNTSNKTLIANGNYNIAKSYEALEEYVMARRHFRDAYRSNPRSVYLRSIDKINSKVDQIFMNFFTPTQETIASSEMENLKLSEKGYGAPTKLHEILGLDKSEVIPEFIDTDMLSENGYARKIDVTNDFVGDIYFNSVMGTGRFTNYYVITKTESGEWKLLKETVGGNCCYEEPDFLTLEGLNYFVRPDRVIRYDKDVIKFHHEYRSDTLSRSVSVKDIKSGSLFSKLIPNPSSLELTRHYDSDTVKIDIDGNGSRDIVTRHGESSGGMGQWFRHEVKVNGKIFWDDNESEGLLRSEVKMSSGNCYFINVYDDFTCKVILYKNGVKTVQSIVKLSESYDIKYVWKNML